MAVVTGRAVPAELERLERRLLAERVRWDRGTTEVGLQSAQVRRGAARYERLLERLLRASGDHVAQLAAPYGPESVRRALSDRQVGGLRAGEPPAEHWRELPLAMDRTYYYPQPHRYGTGEPFNLVSATLSYPTSQAGEPGRPRAGMRADAGAGTGALDRWYALQRLVFEVEPRPVLEQVSGPGGWVEWVHSFPGHLWIALQVEQIARGSTKGNRNALSLWASVWWTAESTTSHVSQVRLDQQVTRFRGPEETRPGAPPWEEAVFRGLRLPAWRNQRVAVITASRVEVLLLPSPAWDRYTSGNSWIESELRVHSARAFEPRPPGS